VLNRLARDPYQPVQAKHRVYFRDLYDHVVRIHDISESLRDLISGALETYLSVVSNRTNDIMKTLTIVTVMFMPMTFLVGFFGTNFFGEAIALTGPMPKRLLFWGTNAIMAVSPCFIWIYARRKKWF
jgi:magnesium transporter